MKLATKTNWTPEEMWDKGLPLVLLVRTMMGAEIKYAQLVDVNTNSMRFGMEDDYAVVLDKDLNQNVSIILENPNKRGDFHRYMNCIIQYLTLQGGLVNGECASTKGV
jgi:hypothetical protein